MINCVFCSIIKGNIPSAKIWEDEEFLAILIDKPNIKGTTIIIPKKHYGSNIFDMPKEAYSRYLLSAIKVAKILEKGLDIGRVGMAFEGMEINHAHIKLFPMIGVKKEFNQTLFSKTIYFEKYEGYLTTQNGPKISIEERKKLAEEILKNAEKK